MHRQPSALGGAISVLLATQMLGASPLAEMRLTPAEVAAMAVGQSQIGSSKLPGVRTTVLYGDPAQAGFFAILLSVPARTTIQAHSHRDDRIATVVSGKWEFGYGRVFDARALKALPPGSVYSEPGGLAHFARTGEESAVVQISGFGPTDTVYVDAAHEPRNP